VPQAGFTQCAFNDVEKDRNRDVSGEVRRGSHRQGKGRLYYMLEVHGEVPNARTSSSCVDDGLGVNTSETRRCNTASPGVDDVLGAHTSEMRRSERSNMASPFCSYA